MTLGLKQTHGVKKMFSIHVWVNRFESAPLLGSNGEPLRYGSYQQAQSYIDSHRQELPLGASPVEISLPA